MVPNESGGESAGSDIEMNVEYSESFHATAFPSQERRDPE
jgi:hypothetical protein